MEIKELVVIVVLFILVLGFSYFVKDFNLKNNLEDINETNNLGEIKEACFDERCFEVEIANTDEERQKGLMFRETLDEDKGMLFIFEEEGIYPFWMKNTLITLDIIWINKEGEIVFIANAVPCEIEPCQIYNPNKEALYVLEVNSGIANEIGLKAGDEAYIP